MPRYEFAEGTSSKFWEIELAGKSFTTTYGKIGTTGQSTTKSFGSDAEAKKEHDKLVAEKVKKGYVAAGSVGGGVPAAAKVAKPTAAAAPAPAKKAAKPAREDDDDDDDDDGDDEDAAAPASKPSGGGRYFEFVEGTSSKFWEITIVGNEVRTRYGKIGTAGQTTLKDLGSPAAAKKEHDKLIAEKTKKGYEEAGAGGGDGDGDGDEDGERGGGEGGPNARNPALEKAIAADPDDDDAYQVYADWLQGQSDPRGELIALQLAGKTAPANKLRDKHAGYFWGDLFEHQKRYDGTDKPAFVWKNGFIHSAFLSHNHYADEEFEGSLAEILTALLDHPSGQFLAELTLVFNNDPNEDTLQDLIDLLAAKKPPALRKLHIGDFEYPDETEMSWFNVGDLSNLWKSVPTLKTLIVQGGSYTLGELDLPALTHAQFITGGMSKDSVASIAKAKWPKLQSLELWLGDDNYGGDSGLSDLQPLLARTDLRALRHLGLMNCAYTDEIAAALPTAAILPQLSELSLAMGVLTDEGAQAIGAHKDAFEHLAQLDVSQCFLSAAGIKALKGCAKKIVADQQRDDEDPEYRSPAVGE